MTLIATKCPSCQTKINIGMDVHEETLLYPGAIVICYSCHDTLLYQGNDVLRKISDDESNEWSDKQRKAVALALKLAGKRK